MCRQPIWKLIANLGDVHPIDYGGLFVYVDTTGVYPPEMERLDVLDNKPCDGPLHNWGDLAYHSSCPKCGDNGLLTQWEVSRVPLVRCTLTNGILSDNSSHPDYPAWFATSEDEPNRTTYLTNIASMIDMPVQELQRLFCSEDPCERAEAYRMIGDYHGWDNLDSYPLMFDSRDEIEKRYANDDKKIWRVSR